MHVLAMLLALTAAVLGQGAAKPDFSGVWTMNTAKSDFGALPGPTSITRTITHAEPNLTIVEEQSGGMGDQKSTRKYKTDGTPSSFEVQGATVSGMAKWSGTTLQVDSTVDAIGITFNDKMSLSADGKTLTSQVHLASPQGEIDITLVFDKK